MSLFVTFEGLDASGKSTQVRLLEEYLRSAGGNVRVLREPGGTPVGESIRAMLLDRGNTDLSDAAELFLFSASRSQLVEQVIRPLLAGGTHVICDRFYDSTTAYQGGGRGLDRAMIAAVNTAATGGLIPDATFFLDVPVETILQRMRKSGVPRDRMESNAVEFHQRVREAYLGLAATEKRFHAIDGRQDIESISRTIRDVCAQLEGMKA